MNTIKKNLTYIVAFLLALGFASLANAEANNVSKLNDGTELTQSLLDFDKQNADVQQSVQPSCGNSSELDFASSSTSTQTMDLQIVPSNAICYVCCIGLVITCCASCQGKTMPIDTDASQFSAAAAITWQQRCLTRLWRQIF